MTAPTWSDRGAPSVCSGIACLGPHYWDPPEKEARPVNHHRNQPDDYDNTLSNGAENINQKFVRWKWNQIYWNILVKFKKNQRIQDKKTNVNIKKKLISIIQLASNIGLEITEKLYPTPPDMLKHS